jgi:tetratricopeptide (TPR) repeat protein
VVTASLDQTARVWDAATGQPVTLPLLHHHGVEGASFSPDGQRVVTACDDGTAQVWEMSGVTRPAEELQRLAQVLSGYRLTASSGLQSLEPEEYSPAWKRLWRTSLGAPSASPVPGWVWHLRQAQECLKARQWAGALRHLSFLLPDYPGPGPLYAERARAYAELGQWEQARADYAQAVPQEGYDLLDGYRLALTQLRWGDVAGYRHTWKHLWERWEPTEDPSWAGLLVWTGALAPQPQADSDRLVTVAEKAVAGMPQNGDVLGILGSALYRAGRYDQAVQRGKEAQALHAAGKVGIGFLVPGFHEGQALRAVGEAGVDTLLQAMAYYRLGQGKEARCCLAQAEQQQSQRETLGDDPPWEVRVAYDLLHREAEELIGR